MKNFENRLTVAEVMTKTRWCTFLTHRVRQESGEFLFSSRIYVSFPTLVFHKVVERHICDVLESLMITLLLISLRVCH